MADAGQASDPIEGRARVDEAISHLDAIDLCASLVAVPSPTGDEHRLAADLMAWLSREGIAAEVLSPDGRSASVVARLGGDGSGESLIIVAGLDTGLNGDPVNDAPWLGPTPRADFRPVPDVRGDSIVGLGAENPKGMATAALMAATALKRAGTALSGDVIVAFVGGAMPYLAEDGPPAAGFGSGLAAVLDTIPTPDHALMLKPGDHVVWTEVGQSWFRVRLWGNVEYTGARHKGLYKNPILSAAGFVERIDSWLTDEYTIGRTGDLLAPQGAVTAVRAGSPVRTVFSPNHVDLFIDLRTAPGDEEPAGEDLARAASEIAVELGVDADVTSLISVPGSETPPTAPIVERAIAAWEHVSGVAHTAKSGGSSASNAWRLRERGIPTARVGIGRSELSADFPGLSMGVADRPHIEKLSRIVADVALRSCTGRSESTVEYDSDGKG